MNYKAILFDMDGVLIDSEGLMVKTGLLALHDFGVDAKPEDFTEFVGKGDDRYVGGVAEKYGLRYDPVMKERLYDYFGQMVAEECNLPEGEKDIIIYLPADATVLIRNFRIDGSFSPARKNEKVLWLGDSITQGYGPLRSGQTYVSVANRILNYDILNQGIGGYVYDKKSLLKMPGYTPDKIIVALGTNQFGCETMQDVEEYWETLTGIYGKEIPILCISPLWRGDIPEGIPTLIRFCGNVKEIAGRYPNVKIADGFSLVPHLPEYFLDNLHPNALGAETYGRNLVEEIRRIGF